MNYNYCKQGNDPIELVEKDIPEISMYLPLVIHGSRDERQHLKGCVAQWSGSYVLRWSQKSSLEVESE